MSKTSEKLKNNMDPYWNKLLCKKFKKEYDDVSNISINEIPTGFLKSVCNSHDCDVCNGRHICAQRPDDFTYLKDPTVNMRLIVAMKEMMGKEMSSHQDVFSIHKNCKGHGYIRKIDFRDTDNMFDYDKIGAFNVEYLHVMKSIASHIQGQIEMYPWKPVITRDEDGQPLCGFIFTSAI